jgi:DNA polymerase III delta prime subunit
MIENEKLNNIVWAEKYRPKTVEEAILPESTKKIVLDSIANGNVPHFLFCGTAGTGKTTLARAIANQMNADLLFVNASLEGVDTIRTKVIQFSSSVSFSGGLKVVLFDEFDGAGAVAQQSLRGIIEEFPNTRFFFTCNFKNKVIDAIHSRCIVIEFKNTKEESPKLQSKFFKRLCEILEIEKVKYSKPVVAELVKKFYPDYRRTLNALQGYAASGEIDAGILADQQTEEINALIDHLKKKKFTEMRKWVAMNPDMDPQTLFRALYDKSADLMDPKCIPSIVILLADYSYKASMVQDPQILVAACLTEIMVGATWN